MELSDKCLSNPGVNLLRDAEGIDRFLDLEAFPEELTEGIDSFIEADGVFIPVDFLGKEHLGDHVLDLLFFFLKHINKDVRVCDLVIFRIAQDDL